MRDFEHPHSFAIVAAHPTISGVTLILFDIDMTLIHTNGAGRLSMDRVLQAWFGVERPTTGVSFDGRTDRAIFQETLHALGDSTPAAVERLIAGYLAGLPAALAERGGTVLPGVAALLDALDAERTVYGLATGNMRRGAMTKLGYFGIAERFAGGGFGDEHAVRADLVSAGIAELARLVGQDPDPSATIVLGDTPLDVEGAHLAGARALAVATGRYSVAELEAAGADWALPDLSDTRHVMSILAG